MDINRNNYENFLLLYLDNELNPSQRQAVEKFLGENTDLQKEFSILSQTVLQPETIVFEHRELLYRQEEKRRRIPVYWLRYAAAVAVLVLGSWLISSRILLKSTMPSDTPVLARGADARALPGKEKTETGTAASNPAKNQVLISPETKNQALIPEETKNRASLVVAADVARGETKSKPSAVRPVNTQNNTAPETAAQATMVREEEELLTGQQGTTLKPSAPLALQAAVLESPVGSPPTPDLAKDKNKALLLSTAAIHDERNYAYAVQEEPVNNENAISVVALDGRNKGISGFFKKLTQRGSADENARKLRVSVFQISY